MNRPLDLWLQRMTLGLFLLLAASLLTVGVMLYAPKTHRGAPLPFAAGGIESSSPTAEVKP